MSIASDLLRGHTETIILSCLLMSDSYGYEINKSIQSQTHNQFELKDATLYGAFRRLEDSSLITSYWGNEGQGARRRYYSITEKGKLAYIKNKNEWQEAKRLIDSLLA